MRTGPLPLIAIGSSVLAVGVIVAVIGGVGEYGYYQCVAQSSSGCTSAGNNQYITIFLANNDLLTVGFNLALVGTVFLVAGLVTRQLPVPIKEPGPSVSPTKVCPKCGAHALATTKFCAMCGASLG